MKKIALAVIALVIGCAAVAPADAATITFAATIDLTTPPSTVSPTRIDAQGGAVTPKQVAVGDTIQIRYDFGGLGLSATEITYGWIHVDDTTGLWGDMLGVSGRFSLLDQAGNAIFTSDLQSGIESFVDIGGQFTLATGPQTFYGVRYDGLLDTAFFGAPLAFSKPYLVLEGSGFQVIPAAVTPIPGAVLLFGSALGGLGVVGWRRRKSAAAA